MQLPKEFKTCISINRGTSGPPMLDIGTRNTIFVRSLDWMMSISWEGGICFGMLTQKSLMSRDDMGQIVEVSDHGGGIHDLSCIRT